jgi:hypothetical protein
LAYPINGDQYSPLQKLILSFRPELYPTDNDGELQQNAKVQASQQREWNHPQNITRIVHPEFSRFGLA